MAKLTVRQIQSNFRKHANKDQAKNLSGFFKTGPGQYGEGDLFLGIKVPVIRAFLKDCLNSTWTIQQKLIHSKYHEERLLGLLILVHHFQKAEHSEQKGYFSKYCANYKYINNWDLVDLTAPNIVGAYLLTHDRKMLYCWAKSPNLWKRRISIVATYTFIRNNDFNDTFKIALLLLEDNHDLIHKAVGWMLREVGKRDKRSLELFLGKYANKMPRTMLRYAIERFPEKQRKAYLKGKAIKLKL